MKMILGVAMLVLVGCSSPTEPKVEVDPADALRASCLANGGTIRMDRYEVYENLRLIGYETHEMCVGPVRNGWVEITLIKKWSR